MQVTKRKSNQVCQRTSITKWFEEWNFRGLWIRNHTVCYIS